MSVQTTMKILLLLVLLEAIFALKLSMSMRNIAVCLFTPGSILRFNDNPLLQYASENQMDVFPILIDDNNLSYKDMDKIYDSLSLKIEKSGGCLTIMKGNIVETLNNHIDNLRKETTEAQIHLLYVPSYIEPIKSSLAAIKNSILHANIIELQDNLIDNNLFDTGTIKSSSDLTNFRFSNYEKLYKNLEKNVPKPKNSIITSYYNKNTMKLDNNNENKTVYGEDFACLILTEYIRLGDREFTFKYSKDYIDTISLSDDHKKSMYCLVSKGSNIWGGSRDSKFFQGEVLSGLINPLISLGCVSPKLLVHAKNILFNSQERMGLEVPIIDRIKNEIIRKDWHNKLAFIASNAKETSASAKADWTIKYTYYQGFIQREGVMFSESKSKDKPLIVLIHGFGGSLVQMSSLAQQLYPEFDIASIDMLGFGHSEKSPLSYNQYFWRDQIVEYIKKVAKGRGEIILLGNSIGGFICTAAIALLAEEYEQNKIGAIRPTGLVLCNSAGDLASDLEGVTIDNLFSAYEGPSSEFLRVFGKVIFSLLQPRIEKTCEWLYPSNKEPVKNLAINILRDSEDPGASDVIASGGKLPTPEPMASLLKKFKGPTLICQGQLDPLNDAEDRARQFGEIRNDIDVDLLSLGHCPFHENPILVSESIKKFCSKYGLIRNVKTIDTVSLKV